jgi:hypothetical protein
MEYRFAEINNLVDEYRVVGMPDSPGKNRERRKEIVRWLLTANPVEVADFCQQLISVLDPKLSSITLTILTNRLKDEAEQMAREQPQISTDVRQERHQPAPDGGPCTCHIRAKDVRKLLGE